MGLSRHPWMTRRQKEELIIPLIQHPMLGIQKKRSSVRMVLYQVTSRNKWHTSVKLIWTKANFIHCFTYLFSEPKWTSTKLSTYKRFISIHTKSIRGQSQFHRRSKVISMYHFYLHLLVKKFHNNTLLKYMCRERINSIYSMAR